VRVYSSGLRSGVNFINVLLAAFRHSDPKSGKNSQVVSLFALLRSVQAKAALRTLMKLTPDGETGEHQWNHRS